ncbi:transposase [Hydrogenimonas cancrithermarum]|uniref:Transposase n=1 Tax=Hydrogenimonas cancrithermarum TaxID=2993563 RepID=A0ABN6WU27_9BACT|nr:transposase [Hydrogenimonas cancrithermarum]BDY12492.1 hypothetical protein HCR_08040 [Hydrogenimonas cancrithermarum]
MQIRSCIYCNDRLYLLGDGMVKCSVCKRKYSPKKFARHMSLIEAFRDDFTTKEAADKLGLNYITAKRVYETLRKRLVSFLEEEYAGHREEIVEYDEYLYLDHTKRKDKKYIFDAHNFLTFDYGGRVYNILMPSLERYKNGFLADGLDELYYTEFSKFLKIHRIAKLRSIDNTIVRFWEYFDEFMKKYNGVRRENFIYYLKEAEFKFNYGTNEQIEILKKLYFQI